MALKRRIKKDAFDKLSDELKAEYKEKDGEYILEVEGDEDTGALKRAKDRETQLRKDAELRATAAEERVTELEKDDGKSKDIRTLEASWQSKNKQLEDEKNDVIKQKDTFIEQMLVDSKAMELASEISTSPKLIYPHIRARLAADLEGEKPETRVLDADGKVSALTLDELGGEFVANKEFASIIKASKAQGSGANSGQQSKDSDSATSTDKTDLTKFSPKEMAAHLSAQKQQSETDM